MYVWSCRTTVSNTCVTDHFVWKLSCEHTQTHAHIGWLRTTWTTKWLVKSKVRAHKNNDCISEWSMYIAAWHGITGPPTKVRGTRDHWPNPLPCQISSRSAKRCTRKALQFFLHPSLFRRPRRTPCAKVHQSGWWCIARPPPSSCQISSISLTAWPTYTKSSTRYVSAYRAVTKTGWLRRVSDWQDKRTFSYFKRVCRQLHSV